MDKMQLKQFSNAAISKKLAEGELTDSEIRETVRSYNQMMGLSEEDVRSVIRELLTMYEITMEKGIAITNENVRDKKWFSSLKESEGYEDPYYSRFLQYMQNDKGWNDRVLVKLDERTNDILNFVGNPNESGSWFTKGLLIGDVQSGKTINYTAISNKAVDAGYKVIVILTGTIESLRKQTQTRMITDFIGKKNISDGAMTGNVHVGVGTYNPSVDVASFTSELKDFNRNFIRQNNLSLKSLKSPAIFIVKKNKSVLDNLNNWLKTYNSTTGNKIDLPLLVIDDESDYASVNTKEEYNPTTINAGIRRLLNNFDKKTYLAVTATPFANIFIHHEHYSDNVGEDLFPEHFIYLLDPPSSYIGAERIFNDEERHYANLQEINTYDLSFPIKHNKNMEVASLPEDLMEALHYFLLVNAAMDYQEDTDGEANSNLHRTMLINMSRFIDVQNQIHDLVNIWLREAKLNIQHYSALEDNDIKAISLFNNLEIIWDKHALSSHCNVEWSTVRKEYLHDAVKHIETRVVNQRSQKKLDYEDYENGLRVIAVGGNSLSRGITLEGLVVSYFYRNSRMYDTLMQMGRWFGYRNGYESLFRIWMTQDAINWYMHITEATRELKNDILRMNRAKMTPKQFGLMVKEHPDTLIITARNKMRSTGEIVQNVNLSGVLLETPRLKDSIKSARQNEELCKNFIKANYGKRDKTFSKGTLLKDVDKDSVIGLVENIDIHSMEIKFNKVALSKFIQDRIELDKWDVYIPSVNKGKEVILNDIADGFALNAQKRNIVLNDEGALLVSGKKVRVGTQGMTKIGLDDNQVEAIRRGFYERHGKNPGDNEYLRVSRKPLLIIHIVTPNEKCSEEIQKKYNTLYALGVGFPLLEPSIASAKYRINSVELMNYFIENDETGDDYSEEE